MIARHLLERLHRAVQRGEVYLAPTDSLLDALRLMRLRGADLLPVVADGGAVVGLVTARTLLDGLAPVVDGLLDNATAALFGPPPS